MPSPTLQRVPAFLSELKRRRVFRATAVYVVFVLAALEGAGILVPALHLPDWTMTLLVVLALVGLPVAVGLAWAFDVSVGGIQRTPGMGTMTESGGGDAAPVGRAVDAPAAVVPDPHGPAAVLRRARATGKPSVAVMPFLDLSGDAENEYFADGITEDVIAHLSKVRALKVISRTSVMPFKDRAESLRQIGARLGATTLVDGSVRRVGDRVRIVAQLVDAETDQHLWAETYDRQLTDIFAIQTDVARHIVTALQAELSADEFCELMLDAQKQTYGDGLDESHLHPYMWLLKPHYYLESYNFYNFPYAFGLLFGLGVYATYLEEGKAFVPRYKELLRSTGEGKAADLAARFGIDIRSKDFWDASLAVLSKQVDRYCELKV